MLLHAGLQRPLSAASLPARQRVRVANLSAGAQRFRRGSTPLRPVLCVVARRGQRHVVSAELSDKGRRFRAADVEVFARAIFLIALGCILFQGESEHHSHA